MHAMHGPHAHIGMGCTGIAINTGDRRPPSFEARAGRHIRKGGMSVESVREIDRAPTEPLALRDGARDGALPVTDVPRVDLGEAAQAARLLLSSLGIQLDGEHRRDTPRRMVQAIVEMLTTPPFSATCFDVIDGYDEFVTVEAVPFFSLCEHHVLPFIGSATVAYVPGRRIIGLSKLARVVELHARRLQVQERMTVEIADWLTSVLEPRGVAVQLRAEHLCMSLRGVRAAGTLTTTTVCRGVIAEQPARRQEWERLLMAARSRTAGA
ncbi:MAG TPA: GTP cyclohydrolase I [Kineosporiaceae bacterium]